MTAPQKYLAELRECAVRLVLEAEAEPGGNGKGGCRRIGQQVGRRCAGGSPRPNYITPDVDGHNVTGGWKMFNRRGQRIGTYDPDLNYLKEQCH